MTVTSAYRMTVAGGLIALAGWVTAGCFLFQAPGPLSTLEEKQVATWTAEDHLAAALLYDKQARELEIEAERFEQEASTITSYEDPKEFRRSALAIVAQERRAKSLEMKQLSAQHHQRAEAMTDQAGRRARPPK